MSKTTQQKPSKNIKLFIHGILTLPHIQKQILGRSMALRSDTLANFTNGSKPHIPFPIAAARKDATLVGGFVKVTPEQMEHIDRYAGERLHRRKVTTCRGRELYVFTEKAVVEDN